MDINHIAKLARINLSETEKEKYSKQFEHILNYVEKLKEVETKNISTADGGTRNLENVWREDNRQPTTNNQQPTKDLISQAPETENGQVKVKSVF